MRIPRVQPSVISDQLRRAAAPHKLTWGPDPATHSQCTFGGMLGNNACGVHAQMAGKAADNVQRARHPAVRRNAHARGLRCDDRELHRQIAQGGRTGEIYARAEIHSRSLCAAGPAALPEDSAARFRLQPRSSCCPEKGFQPGARAGGHRGDLRHLSRGEGAPDVQPAARVLW